MKRALGHNTSILHYKGDWVVGEKALVMVTFWILVKWSPWLLVSRRSEGINTVSFLEAGFSSLSLWNVHWAPVALFAGHWKHNLSLLSLGRQGSNWEDRSSTYKQQPLKCSFGTSLVAQWLRIHLPMQGTRVRALVREDPTCRGATKPARHNYWACALEPVSHNYWSPSV